MMTHDILQPHQSSHFRRFKKSVRCGSVECVSPVVVALVVQLELVQAGAGGLASSRLEGGAIHKRRNRLEA